MSMNRLLHEHLLFLIRNNMDIVQLSKELMQKQTEKNKAPAWLLTEIAIRKGKELSKRYHVNEKLVLTSLYLAHTIFSPIWNGDIQKNHPNLSAKFVKEYLDKWNILEDNKKIILNAIEAHHGKIETESKIAEIVKNAEGFKFLTVEGSLIFLHELGKRGFSYEESVKMVLEKMNQKMKLLTLDECIHEADKNKIEILKLFYK